MNHFGLIAGLVIIVAIVAIIGIKIYKQKKATGVGISFDGFIDAYSGQIIRVLVDVIQLIKLDNSTYKDKNEYEYAVIYMTIDKLKENSTELGIDNDIIEIIDTDTLARMIQYVLHNNLKLIFDQSAEFLLNIENRITDKKNDVSTTSTINGDLPYVDTVASFDSAETL